MDFKDYFKKNKAKLSDRDVIAIRIGGAITEARLRAGLSQSKLAQMIGTKQPSLARAENGDIIPGIEFLYKIAKALKIELSGPKFEFADSRQSLNFHSFSSNSSKSQGLTSPYFVTDEKHSIKFN